MSLTEVCSALESFDQWQLTLFTAALAERQYPNYGLFCEAAEWGDASLARRQLDRLWDALAGRAGATNVDAMLEKLDAITPDPDQFDFYGVQPALDFCVSLHAALCQLLEADAEEACGVAQVSQACVDTFLEISAPPDLSDEELVRHINTHELMELEQTFQAELVLLIGEGRSGDPRLADACRALAANEGVSNIGISLE